MGGEADQHESYFDKEEYLWEHTNVAMETAKTQGEHDKPDGNAPYGYYQRRRILGRDTAINDSVYIPKNTEYGIVIDDKKKDDTKMYDDIYNSCMEKIDSEIDKSKRTDKKIDLQKALKIIHEFVDSYLCANKGMDDIEEKYKLSDTKGKITLTAYLSEKVNNPKIKTLLIAYILERAKGKNRITGNISVDTSERIQTRTADPQSFEGSFVRQTDKTFVRYTTQKGEIYIIDSSEGYVGSIENSSNFDYRRPGET